MTYCIKRHYHPDLEKESVLIEEGLTLEEAQDHCSSDDTSRVGAWFDAFHKEEE